MSDWIRIGHDKPWKDYVPMFTQATGTECAECAFFTRSPVNPEGGIGSCKIGASPRATSGRHKAPLYPTIKHDCTKKPSV